MRVLVLGSAGFIGSAIAAEAARLGHEVVGVGRERYAAFVGTACDILVNACGNARKYLDERDPVAGYEKSVSSTLRALRDFHYGVFVQISSGAVYPREDSPAENSEDIRLAPPLPTLYGFHKWMAEQLVLQHAPRHVILRIGGAVGPGLRKNPVYDLLAGAPLYVHPDSRFQFIDSRDAARAVFDLCARESSGGRIYNLCGRGTVSVRQVARWAGKDIPPDAESLPRVCAELNLAKVAAGWDLPSTEDSVRRFIREVQAGEIVLPQ